VAGSSSRRSKVGQLLRSTDFSLQPPAKGAEGAEHEDREAPFHHINDRGKAHMNDGKPAISADAKKKLRHEVARRERVRGLQGAGGAGFRPSGVGRGRP
jgi:Rhodopirellula transposase DDE domain